MPGCRFHNTKEIFLARMILCIMYCAVWIHTKRLNDDNNNDNGDYDDQNNNFFNNIVVFALANPNCCFSGPPHFEADPKKNWNKIIFVRIDALIILEYCTECPEKSDDVTGFHR